MKLSKITRPLLLIWLCIVGPAASYAVDSVSARIVIFLACAVASVVLVRGDLRHPVCWFVPVFTLYSLAAPGFAVLGFRAMDERLAAMSVLLQHIAFAAFVAGTLIGTPQRERGEASVRPAMALVIMARPLFWGSLAFAIAFASILWLAGVETKEELVRSGSLLFRLQGVFSLLLMSAFVQLYATHRRSPQAAAVFWLGMLVVFTLVSMVSAERDILLRYVIVSVLFCHFFVRRVQPTALVGFGIVCIALLGALGVYRTAELSLRSAAVGTALVEQSLGGEFQSAGANLAILLDAFESGRVGFKHGATFVADVLHVFTSSGLLETREQLEIGGAWFNRTFFSAVYSHGGGRGFTLVGEAYLNFGTVGIVGLFALLGIVLRRLSAIGDGSLVGALLYALIVPGVLYAIRGDLATLLAYTVKQVAIPVVVLTLCGRLLIRVAGKPSTYAAAAPGPPHVDAVKP